MIVTTASTGERVVTRLGHERQMAAAMKLLHWLDVEIMRTNATQALDKVRTIVGQAPMEMDYHPDGSQFTYDEIREYIADYPKRHLI